MNYFTSPNQKIETQKNIIVDIHWVCGDGCCSDTCRVVIPTDVKTVGELVDYLDYRNTTPRSCYWKDIVLNMETDDTIFLSIHTEDYYEAKE